MKARLLKRLRSIAEYKFTADGKCHIRFRSRPLVMNSFDSIAAMLQFFYLIQTGDDSLTWLDLNWESIFDQWKEKLATRTWNKL